MNYYLKLGMILLLIAAVASGILALVNSVTQPIIEENRRQAEEEARREVLPEALQFVLVEADFSFYIGYDSDNKVAGYTFVAQKMGYSGAIQTMAGVNREFEIESIKIIDQMETPGLGANCTRPEFTEQFSGLSEEELLIDKDGGEIETITGATITTRAITQSLQEGIAKLQDELTRLSEETGQEIREIEKEEIENFLGITGEVE